jgi:hypothetical protein
MDSRGAGGLARNWHGHGSAPGVAALRVLQEAWKKDWRAAAEFLRLGFREDYSARAGIPVETANVLPGQIIVDTALLEELSRAYDESIATTTCEPRPKPGLSFGAVHLLFAVPWRSVIWRFQATFCSCGQAEPEDLTLTKDGLV